MPDHLVSTRPGLIERRLQDADAGVRESRRAKRGGVLVLPQLRRQGPDRGVREGANE